MAEDEAFVGFGIGDESKYDSTTYSNVIWFAPNTKQIFLNAIKYIPKNLSELVNDAGFLDVNNLNAWNGSNNITTLGTITSGVWNGTPIENDYLAKSSISIAGASVYLGGRISSDTLKTKLGLQDLAYKASLSFSELKDKPTSLLGYGIVDAVDTTNNQEINGIKTFNNEVEFNSRAYFAEDVQVDGMLSCQGLCDFVDAVRIGGTNGVTLYYDSANDCLRTDKGIASDGFVSAKGVDSTNSTIAELQQRIAMLEAQIASLTNN